MYLFIYYIYIFIYLFIYLFTRYSLEKNFNCLICFFVIKCLSVVKILATGCIDVQHQQMQWPESLVSDYNTQERKKFDVTITLKPANKNVVTGKIKFELSSVMLEDDLPW